MLTMLENSAKQFVWAGLERANNQWPQRWVRGPNFMTRFGTWIMLTSNLYVLQRFCFCSRMMMVELAHLSLCNHGPLLCQLTQVVFDWSILFSWKVPNGARWWPGEALTWLEKASSLCESIETGRFGGERETTVKKKWEGRGGQVGGHYNEKGEEEGGTTSWPGVADSRTSFQLWRVQVLTTLWPHFSRFHSSMLRSRG